MDSDANSKKKEEYVTIKMQNKVFFYFDHLKTGNYNVELMKKSNTRNNFSAFYIKKQVPDFFGCLTMIILPNLSI